MVNKPTMRVTEATTSGTMKDTTNRIAFLGSEDAASMQPRQFGRGEQFLSPRAREEQCLPADPARSALARSLRTSNL